MIYNPDAPRYNPDFSLADEPKLGVHDRRRLHAYRRMMGEYYQQRGINIDRLRRRLELHTPSDPRARLTSHQAAKLAQARAAYVGELTRLFEGDGAVQEAVRRWAIQVPLTSWRNPAGVKRAARHWWGVDDEVMGRIEMTIDNADPEAVKGWDAKHSSASASGVRRVVDYNTWERDTGAFARWMGDV